MKLLLLLFISFLRVGSCYSQLEKDTSLEPIPHLDFPYKEKEEPRDYQFDINGISIHLTFFTNKYYSLTTFYGDTHFHTFSVLKLSTGYYWESNDTLFLKDEIANYNQVFLKIGNRIQPVKSLSFFKGHTLGLSFYTNEYFYNDKKMAVNIRTDTLSNIHNYIHTVSGIYTLDTNKVKPVYWLKFSGNKFELHFYNLLLIAGDVIYKKNEIVLQNKNLNYYCKLKELNDGGLFFLNGLSLGNLCIFRHVGKEN